MGKKTETRGCRDKAGGWHHLAGGEGKMGKGKSQDDAELELKRGEGGGIMKKYRNYQH